MATIEPPPRKPHKLPDGTYGQEDFVRYVDQLDAWALLVFRAFAGQDTDLGDFETRIDTAETDIDTLESGKVEGPSASVARHIPRFADNTGKVVENTAVEITDAGDITNFGAADAIVGFAVGGVLVVTEQQPAITSALTGGSATAANAADTVNLVLAAMRTHGLIDT